MEFYLDVKQALGDFELQCLARVQTSPAGQWQRYGWVLERRFGYIASERRDIIVHDEPAIDPQKLLGTTDPDEAAEAGTDDAMGSAVAKADPTQLSQSDVATLCAVSPCAWAMFRRGLVPAAVAPGIESLHLEWFTLLQSQTRLCIVGPRFHGKSETTTSWLAWNIIYRPGIWVQIFSATEALAAKLKRRVDDAVRRDVARPHAAAEPVRDGDEVRQRLDG